MNMALETGLASSEAGRPRLIEEFRGTLEIWRKGGRTHAADDWENRIAQHKID
jgi:hypothetical protein